MHERLIILGISTALVAMPVPAVAQAITEGGALAAQGIPEWTAPPLFGVGRSVPIGSSVPASAPAAFAGTGDVTRRVLLTASVAAAGSVLGLAAGSFAIGYFREYTGGDYGEVMTGAALGGAVGSAVLSSIAAYQLGSRGERATSGRSFWGAVLGIVPGALGALAVGNGGSELSFVLGLMAYGLGQGITTALFTVP